MNHINWEAAFSEAHKNASIYSAEREQAESVVLTNINTIEIPKQKLLFPQNSLLVAQNFLTSHQHIPDLALIIDGILFRTSGKREEIVMWTLNRKIEPEEMLRRADVLKGIGYRRMVLKQVYEFITNEKWSTKKSNPEELIAQMAQIEEAAQVAKLQDDYTDTLF